MFVRRLLVCSFCTCQFLLLAAEAVSGQWPQILGPARNGHARDEKLLESWAEDGPRQLWQRGIGKGYSGPAILDRRVVIFHRVGDEEIAEALDIGTGRRIWKNSFPARFEGQIFPDENGPLAVPVIQKNRVYLYGAGGDLHAIALDSGRPIWSRSLYEQYRQRSGVIDYGYFGAGSSPIVLGDQILVNVGGRKGAGIVALAAKNGKTTWTATDEGPSYSSPTMATCDGVQHLIFVTRLNVVSVDPDDGTVRFRMPFGRRGPTVNAATPLVVNSRLFVSASYGIGAIMAKFDERSVQEVWKSDDVMSSQYATSIYHDGHLYGVDGRADVGSAALRCVAFETGRVVWSKKRFGIASLMMADEKMLIMHSDGRLIMAQPSTKGYQTVAEAALFDSTVRALPALADGRFIARDATKLKCFQLGAVPRSK